MQLQPWASLEKALAGEPHSFLYMIKLENYIKQNKIKIKVC